MSFDGIRHVFSNRLAAFSNSQLRSYLSEKCFLIRCSSSLSQLRVNISANNSNLQCKINAATNKSRVQNDATSYNVMDTDNFNCINFPSDLSYKKNFKNESYPLICCLRSSRPVFFLFNQRFNRSNNLFNDGHPAVYKGMCF